ncbi:hypothetical protein ACRWQL_00815 (plasmid) [Shewanella sp. HL-SH4]|uniref:hypothetical protein n=1 Tax=Shewanella TaxID=22 RepID=UPI003D7AA207
MFNQLAELKNIGGVERLNFSIEFLSGNTARVVITSQINKAATGELATLLKRPIVVTGTLSDLDMMLTNELFNFSTEITHAPAQSETSVAPQTEIAALDDFQDDVELDDSESL